MKKSVSILILATVLLPCCVIYQKVPVPLNESLNMGRAKIITNKGEELKFKNIIREDSIYYGLRKKNIENAVGKRERVDMKINLIVEDVEAVFLKDKSKSTWATILLVPLAYGVFVLGVFLWLALFGFGV